VGFFKNNPGGKDKKKPRGYFESYYVIHSQNTQGQSVGKFKKTWGVKIKISPGGYLRLNKKKPKG